ncbi:unnamed protein product, partial [Arabidopsis halleri]
TVLKTDLAIIPAVSSDLASALDLIPAAVSKPSIPSIAVDKSSLGVELGSSSSAPQEFAGHANPQIETPSKTLKTSSQATDDSWVKLVKGTSKELKKKGIAFTLPSGEVCVKIPNSVIENNRKSWECFVIGQFYSDPPSQGTLHNIVNGIWSKYYRDISVSKLDRNAFLFRIPNVSTRNHVINQRLWQIEGQTMFVAKWEPGLVPEKPALTSAPIWLELRNVPLQFFHEQGLERIAGLVGDPKFLHPSTANKTNLEVAKVFTIIDPRKPLPKAVNVQFDSGEIARILVSSPWMPPVCGHCKEIGHTQKRCSKAPVSCSKCNSTVHLTESCPKLKTSGPQRRQQKKHSIKEVPSEILSNPQLKHQLLKGEASGLSVLNKTQASQVNEEIGSENSSEVEPDCSDTFSSDHDDDDGSEVVFEKFQTVLSKKQRKSVKVVVIAKSLQMVSCEVLFPDAVDWIVVSFIYASNEEGLRQELWTEIVNMASSHSLIGKAWIVLGDFNQTLCPSEHSRPFTLNVDRKTREFRNCLLNADLSDLTFRGSSFTWWNKSKTSPVAKKLDRILVNSQWAAAFPNSYALFGEPDFSDHASCGVVLNSGFLKEKRPFKFYNFLLQNKSFLPMIAEHWFSCNVTGSDMLRVSLKLKYLKICIRTFNKENYSDLEKRVTEAHDLLLLLQSRTLANPSIVNANLELEAERKWHILQKAEESFFMQRSCISWLKDGDSNSAYFHRMVATRKAQNHIHFLFDSQDVKVESQFGIRKLCVDYFSELLGGEVSGSGLIQSDMDLLLPFRCSSSQQQSLETIFSREEIKDAFFSLPRNKTSGPDGYSAEFFIACWSVVGYEVTEAVLEFFRSDSLLRQWNATTLVLIPKSPNAARTTEFRPISCLNTVYKVISKLLASRLQNLLPQFISSSQSAFLPGRLLGENVLLATGVVQDSVAIARHGFPVASLPIRYL